MNENFYKRVPDFRNRLSFAPLLKKWRNIISNGEGNYHVLSELIEQFSAVSKMIHPIDDYTILQKHKELVDKAIITLYPLTLTNDAANAITPPFSNKVIYASGPFKKKFMDQTGMLLPFDPQVAANIVEARIALAYKIILKKYYNIDLAGGDSFICAYPEPLQNIFNYFELTWDWQFVEVSSSNFSPPPLPQRFLSNCDHIYDLDSFPELVQLLPLDQFVFEGFLLLSVSKVTEREASKKINEILQLEDVFEDPKTMELLNEHLRLYLQLHQIDAGVTSFHFDGAASDVVQQPSSIILKDFQPSDWKTTIEFLKQQLKEQPYFFTDFDSQGSSAASWILKHSGYKSAILVALFHKNEIAGCLEIYSNETVSNFHVLMMKLRNLIPQFEFALHKGLDDFSLKINRVVKEHFTALQPSVEWKFNQIAVRYLTQPSTTARMEPVVFENVYPLYAAFDIRNSSTERNKAIQLDLMTQLDAVKNIFQKASHYCTFPVLQELSLEVKQYIGKISGLLLPDEESVQQLLKVDVPEMLRNLSENYPDLKKEIASYFLMTEKSSGLVNYNQKKYDDTVTFINQYLSGLIDREQKEAQSNYPHYFERFASDGVEFNIYVGQSIAPTKKYNSLYLNNLRLWQLEVLALGAKHLHHIKEGLAVPLETTQLVLVYNLPIAILFRIAERKFDVDGSQHARYEVVKKRIDKACVKNTGERLTKPGTIAIIYFNEMDIIEYYRYIQFLKQKKLLEGEPEKLELEDLQGVSGLKALRIRLNLIATKETKKKNEPGAEEVQSS